MKFSAHCTILILVVLLGCTASNNPKVINKDVNAYTSLFVMANTADVMARVRLEKEFAAVADLKGFKVVKCFEVLPISLRDPKLPTIEEFENKVKETNSEVLCIVQLLKVNETLKHSPGINFKGYDENSFYLGAILGGILGYTHPTGTLPTPKVKPSFKTGSFTNEKAYYLSIDIVGTKSKNILFTENSEAFDYDNLESFNTGYMVALFKRMELKKVFLK